MKAGIFSHHRLRSPGEALQCSPSRFLVNDTNGHTADNKLLKEVVGLIGRFLRHDDTSSHFTFFMENLDATVITTSLPSIARDFRPAPAYLSIGVSAYIVPLTVFIPVSGWAADRFGARRIFATEIALFTAASLLCAVGQGLWSFTAGRTRHHKGFHR